MIRMSVPLSSRCVERGEAVAQRVHGHPLVQIRGNAGGPAGRMQSIRMQRMCRVAAGEQPVRRPCLPPVAAQDAEQLRRQHDVAVLAALALLNADHHPAAVDVGELEAGQLGRTQSGGIASGQRDPVLQVGHRLEEPHHLLGTEHDRKLAWFARIGDPLRQVGSTQRGAVEEPQRTDDLVQPRPRDAAGDQIQLECTHVVEAKPVRRAAKNRLNFATAWT